MERKEALDIIYKQFDESVHVFCEETNGVFYEVKCKYKGEELSDNLKYRYAKIYYKLFVVEFKYTAHGVMGVVNSILEARVYLDKTEKSVAIPLPLLIDYCNVNTTTPLCIPFISNKEGMIQAFDCIKSVVKSIFNGIETVSEDNDKKEKILKQFTDELREVFNIKPDDTISKEEGLYQVAEDYQEFFTLRFTSAGFINNIKGDKERAIKQLTKIKKKTGYEKRVLNILKTEESVESADLSAIRKNADAYNASGVQKADLKEFAAVFLPCILISVVISLGYIGLYFLLLHFEEKDSIYLMGPIYNFPFCILFGFITSIVVSYFTRFKFYKIMFKKDYEKFCEMDHIQNGGGADRFMKVFLEIVVLVSIAGCVLLTRWGINFYSNGFVDNTDFFSLKGAYYNYDYVERVYYKADRINGFGEKLDFPSYVLVLNNGKEIDMYEFDDISNYENELLDYLREKGVKIEK